MRWRLAVLMVLILGGLPVQAVQLEFFPDKAMYRPNETVRLRLEHSSAERPRAVQAELRITLLETEVYRETKTLDLTKPEPLEFSWVPPPNAAGYGATVTLTDPGGTYPLEVAATAFDVHQRWLEQPRYGFLSDFSPAAPQDDRVAQLAKYHLNALQFYDWMYRHDQHLPPQAEFVDPLGRAMSLTVVERRIQEAHAAGMAAMPYTTIYAASMSYYAAHPTEALYRFNGQPWNFGDNFLMTMNPSAGSGWRTHIMGEYARILEAEAFDGLHIDQYGDPKVAADAQGKTVQLSEVIPGFLQEAKTVAARFPGRDAVIFNLVNDWPVETVAPSGVDAVYIEVWPPHDDYASLRDLVYNAKRLSKGKPVILAAYLTPKAESATKLLESVIAASGASHLELGEDTAILADPYFPKHQAASPALLSWLRQYYDFITRYQHYLYSGEGFKPDQLEVSGAPFTTGSFPSQKVWGLASKGGDFEALHLMNLSGCPLPYWRTAQPPIKSLHHLTVRYHPTRPVSNVYAASPDDPLGALHPLEFSVTNGVLNIQLPRLETWTMIVLKTRTP